MAVLAIAVEWRVDVIHLLEPLRATSGGGFNNPAYKIRKQRRMLQQCIKRVFLNWCNRQT
jgi:hypothetical protein